MIALFVLAVLASIVGALVRHFTAPPPAKLGYHLSMTFHADRSADSHWDWTLTKNDEVIADDRYCISRLTCRLGGLHAARQHMKHGDGLTEEIEL